MGGGVRARGPDVVGNLPPETADAFAGAAGVPAKS